MADWARTTAEMAAMFGLTPQAVLWIAKRHGLGTGFPHCVHPPWLIQFSPADAERFAEIRRTHRRWLPCQRGKRHKGRYGGLAVDG